MASNEFPRLLYRKSEKGRYDVWDLGKFETHRANDQTEVDVLLAEGWSLRPDDEPAPSGKKAAKTGEAKASA